MPFKKDIIFKSNLAEITSISLEHSLHFDKEHFITGEFMVSGEYLMSDTSSDTEIFSYNLPFDIHLDEHYMTDHAEVDIHDFYYEIVDNNVLTVNIEVAIDKLEEHEMVTLEEVEEPELEEVRRVVEPMEVETEKEMEDETQAMNHTEKFDIVKEEPRTMVNEQIEPIDINETSEATKVEVKSEVEETEFSTYRVYILREEDTLESVMMKYSVSKESLEEYNNLNELKIGDKLIIPSGIHH